MANEFSRGFGLEKLDPRHDIDRRLPFNTKLSLQRSPQGGSEWDTAVRYDPEERKLDSSVRNDDGGSATRSGREDSDAALPRNSGGLRAGNQRNRRDRNPVQESRVQNTGGTQLAELPDVPHGYWEPSEEAATGASGDGVRNGDDVLATQADHDLLARVASKGLQVLEEVLNTPTPPQSDPNFARILSTKKDAAVSAVGARLKADENCFRHRQSNALDRLYAEMKAELAVRTIEHVVT